MPLKKILQNFEGHDHWHCQYITFWVIYIFQSEVMLLKYGNLMLPAGHILDLYCFWLSNTLPFCGNYIKLYFDAKHKIFGARFSKKYPFWPISNAALNFWNMPWPGAFLDKVTHDIDCVDEAVVQCYVSVVKIIL